MGITNIAAADALYGTWKTSSDNKGNFGYIRFDGCGLKICGTLVKAFDVTGANADSDDIGKMIVWDMVAKGDGAYDGGRIWAADRDKTYRSKMVLDGDELRVKGCILMVCLDGGAWTRVD